MDEAHDNGHHDGTVVSITYTDIIGFCVFLSGTVDAQNRKSFA